MGWYCTEHWSSQLKPADGFTWRAIRRAGSTAAGFTCAPASLVLDDGVADPALPHAVIAGGARLLFGGVLGGLQHGRGRHRGRSACAASGAEGAALAADRCSGCCDASRNVGRTLLAGRRGAHLALLPRKALAAVVEGADVAPGGLLAGLLLRAGAAADRSDRSPKSGARRCGRDAGDSSPGARTFSLSSFLVSRCALSASLTSRSRIFVCASLSAAEGRRGTVGHVGPAGEIAGSRAGGRNQASHLYYWPRKRGDGRGGR